MADLPLSQSPLWPSLPLKGKGSTTHMDMLKNMGSDFNLHQNTMSVHNYNLFYSHLTYDITHYEPWSLMISHTMSHGHLWHHMLWTMVTYDITHYEPWSLMISHTMNQGHFWHHMLWTMVTYIIHYEPWSYMTSLAMNHGHLWHYMLWTMVTYDITCYEQWGLAALLSNDVRKHSFTTLNELKVGWVGESTVCPRQWWYLVAENRDVIRGCLIFIILQHQRVIFIILQHQSVIFIIQPHQMVIFIIQPIRGWFLSYTPIRGWFLSYSPSHQRMSVYLQPSLFLTPYTN